MLDLTTTIIPFIFAEKQGRLIDFKKILNPQQLQAVMHTEGPLMIIAGAGSGKTRVLTYRIAYLMTQGVDPFNILALTFTNKAAREMKERIAEVVGESEAKNLWMGTFHSVFARILRREADKLGYTANFTIYDQEDAVKATKKIIKELKLDTDIYKPKQIYNRISIMKNNLITTRVYENTPELLEQDELAKRPEFLNIYKKYNHALFTSNAMDFDDLLLKTNELLALHPETLDKYQRTFRYIMVDEYQDTNHSQYTIVRALADRHRNIAVVGDDSQSIYSFRGANIRNILNFQKDYPEATVYRLEQNYRSTKNIVGAGNSLIRHNRMKLEKTLWTSNEPGEKLKILSAPTDLDEARMVVSDIREQMLRHGAKYSDFAILYRTNSQSRALESALLEQRIPFRIYGGMSFYQRKEIKDVLAYLRLIINPKDEEALRRIINFPARGIGAGTMDKLTVAAAEKRLPLFDLIERIDEFPDLKIRGNIRYKLKSFATMIRSFRVRMQELNVKELTKELLKETKLLEAYTKEDPIDGPNRVENISELLNAMEDFLEIQAEVDEGDTSLTAFLQEVSLLTDQDRDDGEGDRVTLMTVHMSKGLEFPYVYVVGLEENLFPSMMSVTKREDLEEERRLLYVAITRAQKRCVLSFALSRYRWGRVEPAEPSRFLDEIDDRYVEVEERAVRRRTNNILDPDIFESDLPFKERHRVNKNPRAQVSASLRPKNLKKMSEVKRGGISEILPEDLHVGDRIRHRKFGVGEITEIIEDPENGHKIRVHFKPGGERVLLLRFAKFEKL